MMLEPPAVAPGGPRLRVVHFTDAAGVGGDRLWGKENVVRSLMHAQRASGRIEPELVTFTPGQLDLALRAAGFRVHTLETDHKRVSLDAIGGLRAFLADGPPAVLHTHEYKANMVGRVARAARAPMRRLVSTCHGWVDRSPQLDVYFAVDRWTAFTSDVVTVTDPAMLERFPALRPKRLVFVQNAIADLAPPQSAERAAARERLGFSADATVVGSLGRLTKNKGILDILEAARRSVGTGIVWAIAGAGPLADEVAHCGLPNVRFLGYQSDNAAYLAALDVYLQASYFEGLSLSLLESMRAGLPSVASRAGATELAVRDNAHALLVDAGDVGAILAAVERLRSDRALAERLGRSARGRFDEAFTIERQQQAFYDLYVG